MANTTYNGWTNYETWAVKSWIDNEQPSYEFWRERAQALWDVCDDKTPNQFMNKQDNAQSMLAEELKQGYDTACDHPVFDAANGTVYADLLNAALSEVNWHEIAAAMLEDRDDA